MRKGTPPFLFCICWCFHVRDFPLISKSARVTNRKTKTRARSSVLTAKDRVRGQQRDHPLLTRNRLPLCSFRVHFLKKKSPITIKLQNFSFVQRCGTNSLNSGIKIKEKRSCRTQQALFSDLNTTIILVYCSQLRNHYSIQFFSRTKHHFGLYGMTIEVGSLIKMVNMD